MKMNQELIERARRGEIAVHNVGCTVEELQQVVKAIWPSQTKATGRAEYYMDWGASGYIGTEFSLFGKKPVPVRDFLTDPTNDPNKGEIGTL